MTRPPPELHWQQTLQNAWAERGPLACALLPVSWVYGGLLWVRSVLYQLGFLRSHRLHVPVVVVGNLIVGGAGKTPTVLALLALLRSQGFHPGVVSRGFRGAAERAAAGTAEVHPESMATQVGDEPLLLRRRGGAPVVVGRDRAAAAVELLRLHPEVNVIVSDDGLQHRALQRDLQIIVFDTRGAGNGWLLPAGPLREALPPALPARTWVIYNATAPSTNLPGSLAVAGLRGLVLLADWRAGHPPLHEPMIQLRGRPVVAAAGVANPQRFFSMLSAAGLDITGLPLPDHHDYRRLPWPEGTPDVIVTEKDAVKLDVQLTAGTRVWVAPLDFQLDPAFVAAFMAALIPFTPSRTRHGDPTA